MKTVTPRTDQFYAEKLGRADHGFPTPHDLCVELELDAISRLVEAESIARQCEKWKAVAADLAVALEEHLTCKLGCACAARKALAAYEALGEVCMEAV